MLSLPSLFLNQDEQIVLDCLSGRVGIRFAISQEDLAAQTSLSRRETQAIVKNLIEEHGVSIGSATGRPNGYFLISTIEEQTRAEAQLEHRIISTAKRLSCLRKLAPAHLLGQLALQINEQNPS